MIARALTSLHLDYHAYAVFFVRKRRKYVCAVQYMLYLTLMWPHL